MRRNLSECGLGTTPRGLTSVGITPDGRAEAAPTFTISAIALETNPWCSNVDLEFGIFFSIGGK
jgi:hypothetical protein